jgi:hypothetical protein
LGSDQRRWSIVRPSERAGPGRDPRGCHPSGTGSENEVNHTECGTTSSSRRRQSPARE